LLAYLESGEKPWGRRRHARGRTRRGEKADAPIPSIPTHFGLYRQSILDSQVGGGLVGPRWLGGRGPQSGSDAGRFQPERLRGRRSGAVCKPGTNARGRLKGRCRQAGHVENGELARGPFAEVHALVDRIVMLRQIPRKPVLASVIPRCLETYAGFAAVCLKALTQLPSAASGSGQG